MMPYSMDLRWRALDDCDAGMATKVVAAKYRVSRAWVRRLKQRRRQTGAVAPALGHTGLRPNWDAYAEQLREAIRQSPTATLAELRQPLGLTVALSTLWRAVAALGLTVIKVTRAAEQTAPTWPPSGKSGGTYSRPSTRIGVHIAAGTAPQRRERNRRGRARTANGLAEEQDQPPACAPPG
jgi:transposase